MKNLFLFIYLSVFVLCSNKSTHILAAKINNDGGYEISLAVQSDATKDNQYISSLKNILGQFSIQLYRTTHGKFYIKSVEILIPSSWTNVSIQNEILATSQSYHTADLRISDSIQDPHTENANLCGSVGNYIELPLSFFDNLNLSPYGQQTKVLLTQWARYRWGVWEEHGFPSSTKFPYMYRNGSGQWDLSGCSNIPLIGTYFDKQEDSRFCDVNSPEPFLSDCRFHPSTYLNQATTSLMHFHWLESVQQFCDKSSHNKAVPNKQNLFCSYKSIWEVIESSSDFKSVTNQPPSELPQVVFNVIRESPSPVLYVLLDKGIVLFPQTAGKISRAISTLFDSSSLSSTIASLGTFPNPNPTSTADSHILERVSWSTISGSKLAFQNAINNIPLDGDVNRDFGLAVIEATEAIKRKASPNGAVLIVVKTGAGAGSFGSLAYEKEVYGALLNQNIKVFGIELQGERSNPTLNLGSWLESVNGVHTIVNSSNVDTNLLPNLIMEIQNSLSIPIPASPPTSFTVFKGFLQVGISRTILVKPNLSRMNFALTSPSNADIKIELSAGTSFVRIVPEWNEASDGERRVIREGYFQAPSDVQLNGGEWSFKYTCESSCGNSQQAHLFVNGIYLESDVEMIEPEIMVFTSAIDNIVDFNITKERNSPFTIFAKAQYGHQPISGLKIQAYIKSVFENENTTIMLVDDGLGSPDIDSNDGIYSGTFIPQTDGTFKITINVINDDLTPDHTLQRIDTRLIPIDQNQFGCSDEDDDETNNCGVIKLSKYYESTFDVFDTISFRNVESFTPFKGKPTRILELNVPDTSVGEITLSFVAPSIYPIEQASNLKYNIYLGQELEHILEHRDNTSLVELRHLDGGRPGSQEEIRVGSSYFADANVWIGIECLNSEMVLKSDLSVVKKTNLIGSVSTSTGPTTTTQEPPTSATDESTESTTTESSPSTSTSSTEESPGEEDKSFWTKAGGIATITALVIIALAIFGGIVWYCSRASSTKGKYSTTRREGQVPPSPPPPESSSTF